LFACALLTHFCFSSLAPTLHRCRQAHVFSRFLCFSLFLPWQY